MPQTTSPGLTTPTMEKPALCVQEAVQRMLCTNANRCEINTDEKTALRLLQQFFEQVLEGVRIDSRQERVETEIDGTLALSSLCIVMDVINWLNGRDGWCTSTSAVELIEPHIRIVNKLLAGDPVDPSDDPQKCVVFLKELVRQAAVRRG